MERKLLIWSTLLILVIFGAMCFFTPKQQRLAVKTDNQLTYGPSTAKVQVVVFEEFACEQCKRFHNDVLKPLFSNYVDKKKVQLVLIPIAYQDESYPAFTAACCVGKVSATHMRSFIDHIFNLKKRDLSDLSSRELTASYAMKENRFPFNQVMECIQSDEMEMVREERNDLASSLYKDDLHFPTVLINGKMIAVPDRQSVFNTIENELKR